MSHVWLSHVARMNESCHKYERVMSRMSRSKWWGRSADAWMSHVTHMNTSCHTYEWVISHMWMSHVTHMNESCHAWAGVNDGVDQQALELQFVREHAKEASKVCFIRMCDTTHWYVWHDSFICVTWLISWHDSFMCVDMTHVCLCTNALMMPLRCIPCVYVTCLIHVVRYDAFICVTWLIHMCDRSHWYVGHDSFMCVAWLIHMCDSTRSCMLTWLVYVRARTRWRGF